MKYLNIFFLVGLTLPFSFLNAEDSLETEPLCTLTEETSLTELSEEALPEKEFETELISLKESLAELPLLVELFPPLNEEVEFKEITASVEAEVQSSQALESEELKSIGLELSLSETPPATSASAVIEEPAQFISSGVSVDLKQAFNGSPIIYSTLLGMSVFSVCLWFYSLASIRLSTHVSSSLIHQMQEQLGSHNFSEALELCNKNKNLFSKMLLTGIQSRKYGLPMVVESMKAEAKRSTIFFWQKLSLLNDIAVIAPMLGLLGTVLGMFYAFYDVNRSIESISTLFDGLGISVGTTVAGLVVAIVALILHSTAKYRLIRALAKVENEAQSLVTLLDHHKQP